LRTTRIRAHQGDGSSDAEETPGRRLSFAEKNNGAFGAAAFFLHYRSFVLLEVLF
jgi:hypothetical protein